MGTTKNEMIQLPEKKGEKEKEKRENGEILSVTFIFGDDDFYLKKHWESFNALQN